MRTRDRRRLENEKLFRRANERLEEQVADVVPRGATIPFLCECGDDLCLARPELTDDEYERVREQDSQFALVPGHEEPAEETVVERHPRFTVVVKGAA